MSQNNIDDKTINTDFTKENIQRIIEYFKSGEKKENLKPLLGVEIEHHIVDKNSKKAITYYGADNIIGIQDLLNKLSEAYPEKHYEGDDLLSLVADDANITLEPANQLEISIAPYEKLDDIKKSYDRFRENLDPILKENNLELINLGYNPYNKCEDLTLIPKKRYDYMDRFFKLLGTNGHLMMRASGSTQVSVDYKDEEDAINKLRLVAALTPILSAMADNLPVLEGKPNETRIERLRIWREVDPKRCQIVPGLFAPNFSFKKYAEKLYNVAPIYIYENGNTVWTGETPAKEIYKNKLMTREEIEHLTSLTWPDVRLKNFVEVRAADSLKEELALGYAALIKGFLYSMEASEKLFKLLGVENNEWTISEKDVEDSISSIQEYGLNADIYGDTLKNWINMLVEIASESLDEGEIKYLNEFKDFALDKPWLIP